MVCALLQNGLHSRRYGLCIASEWSAHSFFALQDAVSNALFYLLISVFKEP
jgi:hypothetical protein